MRARLCFLVGGLTLTLGCHRGGIQGLTPVLSSARVYYDDGPAFRDTVRRVVRDLPTWKTVWTQATSTQASPPPLPAINFDQEMMPVVGAGRMTPAHQIPVDPAAPPGDLFVVVVRTIMQCRPFRADVYPLEIVRVSHSDKRATFVEQRERAANC